MVIELRKDGVPARAAFDDNLTSYEHPRNGILTLFVYSAQLTALNGTNNRVRSITADWQRFFEVRAGLALKASSVRTGRAGCRSK